jgi:hypothetical protein
LRKTIVASLFIGFVIAFATMVKAQTNEIIVIVRNAPAHGIAMAKVDLSQILKRLGAKPFSPASLQAQLPDGRKLPIQFVPESENEPAKGWLLLKLPKGGNWTVWLRVGRGARDEGRGEQNGTVRTKHFTSRPRCETDGWVAFPHRVRRDRQNF